MVYVTCFALVIYNIVSYVHISQHSQLMQTKGWPLQARAPLPQAPECVDVPTGPRLLQDQWEEVAAEDFLRIRKACLAKT